MTPRDAFRSGQPTPASIATALPDPMQITDLLAPEHVVAGLRAPTKAAVLADLARRAGAAVDLDPAAILSALRRREALGSTGVGGGIAIPHARLAGVRRPFGLFARLRAPVDFDAVDERPVDLVFLLLLPTDPRGEHLNALACIARCLRDASVSAGVHGARDAAGIYAVVRGHRTVGVGRS